MHAKIGLYIHVPFCVSKCPYCDFYSLTDHDDSIMDVYTDAVLSSMDKWRQELNNKAADTLYLGGGTPSLLGGTRIKRIIDSAVQNFGLENAEITIEANPGDINDRVFYDFASAGGNRISLGMQTNDNEQLEFLKRRHKPKDVENSVAAARAAGIDNISLDMMLGLKGQTVKSVVSDASQAFNLGAKHISAYLLKVEHGTPFYQSRDTLSLPDDEEAAQLYLGACETLEMLGYFQYEISNFAVIGYESRHNLKYWESKPYLGIGPAAHSFIDGKRFYYTPDLKSFLDGCMPVREGEENWQCDAEEREYMMLRLRLTKGISQADYKAKFGCPIPQSVVTRAGEIQPHLIYADSDQIRLTRLGFLLSNTLIYKLLYE